MSKLGDAVSTTGPVLPIGGGKGVTGGLCLLRSLTAEGMKLALPLFFSIQGQQHIFYQRTGSESTCWGYEFSPWRSHLLSSPFSGHRAAGGLGLVALWEPLIPSQKRRSWWGSLCGRCKSCPDASASVGGRSAAGTFWKMVCVTVSWNKRSCLNKMGSILLRNTLLHP